MRSDLFFLTGLIFANSTYRFTLKLKGEDKFLAIDRDGCHLQKKGGNPPVLQKINKPTENSYNLEEVGTNFTAIVNVVKHYDNHNISTLNCDRGKDGTTNNKTYHYTQV